MSNNQMQNIERAVLSTIIFEPEHLDYIQSLNAQEFTLPEHQQVFTAMRSLYNNGKPITEDFILKIIGNSYEYTVIDILSALPISNIEAYIVDIQTSYKKRLLQQGLANLANIDDTDIQKTLNGVELLLDKVQNIHTVVTNKDFTIGDLIKEKFPDTEKFLTGIKFMDDIFHGFELGHLITVTGEQESGKTQLTNQILLSMSNQHKSLYFSLEFNKRKLHKYMQNKTNYDLDNIYTVTQDMIDGDIDEICRLIKYHYKNNSIKIVAIDSQMMIWDESKKFNTSEEETTSLFRKLHKLCNTLDIIIFIIAQSSKADHKNVSSIEIFGSKKASHLADIQIHLFNDKEDSKYRNLWVGKNKQNGARETKRIVFNKTNLEFNEVMTDKEGFKITSNDSKTTKEINNARSKFKFSD